MKKMCPEYPLFLVELSEPNCPVYWIPEEFADIEFLGTVPFGNVLSDDAMENLLMLTYDDQLNVYVGGVISNGHLVGGARIGRLYEKDGRFWHHLFAAESRSTVYAAARAMYRKLRLHRTSIGVNVLKDFQNKRSF